MSSVRDQLESMFSKVMAGTVTREEGAMLISHLTREDQDATISALAFLIDNPPPNVYQKTILHSIALARNKAFFPLMVSCLDHKNEDVSIFAADELARLHSEDSRKVLIEHLNSEAYHVRKASAMALAQGFGRDGVAALKEHVLNSKEPFHRITSAEGLMSAGRSGVEALIGMLASESAGPIETVAEVLEGSRGDLAEGDLRQVVDVLMRAGDSNDSQAIVAILRVLASCGPTARSFEDYVRAFSDYPSEPVREEVKKTLSKIGSPSM